MPRPLPKNDWRRRLHPGDEITHAPRGGEPRTGVIIEIEFLDGDIARIAWGDGWREEIPLREVR